MKCTPPNIKESAQNVVMSLLPDKSKSRYEAAYNKLLSWQKANHTTSFSENVILAYFNGLSEHQQPSTLWSVYSMLKSTVSVNKNIDIGKYARLQTFLKKKNSSHKPKKSKIFTAEDIEKYLKNAPNEIHLANKVILVFGFTGACRREELTKISLQDVSEHNSSFIIKIPTSKTGKERSFVIGPKYYETIKQFMRLRPASCHTFFLNFQKGKCTKQAIGINKMGAILRQIATYLNLDQPELYTGHSFRRTSATLLADAGADILTLKRHGGNIFAYIGTVPS